MEDSSFPCKAQCTFMA